MNKKVLLTSVCRPIGPKHGDAPSVGYELLHGQVTRAQGLFSPRTFNNYFSLDYIAENLDAPTVVLQYPSRRELIRELKTGAYDYVGVSFIMALMHKMKDVVALIREHSPQSKIVLGGYGTILGEDVLRPYGDYFCREEGVAFFRRLLGETPLAMPYKHPLLVSWLKIFGWKASGTGKILAGLGCPNGCDFCCTSHFFQRQHIRLLPTGQDIYRVAERYLEMDPDLVLLIIDEDFLLNRKRAMEFRDAVLRGGKTLSIFVFSSIKAISQYTVEEILEMGIDGFWIGYEGTRSGYGKQEGRPVDEILTEFREHGITILTSMILGFEYQDPQVIAREFDGLMALKPSLTQFLIYGPVPGTPFGERVMRDGSLQEIYKQDTELMYRRADGFATMMKHPSLSAEEIEELQRGCYEEDFQRLGPSIFRTLEARLLGYQRLKDSPNPALRKKAEFYARELRVAYPVFLAGRCLGPNAEVRRWIRQLEQEMQKELGLPTLTEKVQSVLAVGAALWTGLTLRLNWFQHPRLTRTEYRMPTPSWAGFHLWEELQRKFSSQDFAVHVDLQHSRRQVWLRLEGLLPSDKAFPLAQRLQESLARSGSRLVLDLKQLRWENVQDLRPLQELLAEYRSRVRLVLPLLAEAHPEIMALARRFKAYGE